jgi:hypothetical protein
LSDQSFLQSSVFQLRGARMVAGRVRSDASWFWARVECGRVAPLRFDGMSGGATLLDWAASSCVARTFDCRPKRVVRTSSRAQGRLAGGAKGPMNGPVRELGEHFRRLARLPSEK